MRVGVRIACEDIGRNLARQVPLATTAGQREVDGRQVARVIAVARADQERNQVAGLDGYVLHAGRLSPHLRPAQCRRRVAAAPPLAAARATRSRRCRIRDGHAAPGPRLEITALTGLIQPAATRNGRRRDASATLCGFRLPGTRTCWLGRLATTLGRSRAAPAIDEVISRRIHRSWPSSGVSILTAAPPVLIPR